MSDVDFAYRIGRVSRSHGLGGEVLVQFFRRRELALQSEYCRWRRLRRRLSVELEYADETIQPMEVTHVRWIDPLRAVLRIAACEDRTAADRLVGAYVDVDPGTLVPELHDDVDQCFDARVLHAESGQHLGMVRRITDNGAQALLEIDLLEGGQALVPVVPDIVVEIGCDAEGRRSVTVLPLPGLFEANR
ncbi:MAG: hypothetical protein KTR25_15410 [Myxococcales bacterium]|nr:hypothetical protein [Myxococcales bacterium]